MRCEVCGHKIYGKPYRVMIEGAKLTVCSQCSKHGTLVWEETTPRRLKPISKITPQPMKAQVKKPSEPRVDANIELAEKFAANVRHARERLGLSHEELGKKINEKASVLKKVETGRMSPDNRLVTKLEHALKIKLLVAVTEEKVSQAKIPKPLSRELTLGDLVQLNKRKKEEETPEREPS